MAVILGKGTEKCLMEWKPANGRLIKIRQLMKQINTTIIRFYASTNNNDKEMKRQISFLLS